MPGFISSYRFHNENILHSITFIFIHSYIDHDHESSFPYNDEVELIFSHYAK